MIEKETMKFYQVSSLIVGAVFNRDENGREDCADRCRQAQRPALQQTF